MRCLLSPQYQHRKDIQLSLASHGYALDNGAYIHHKKRESFDNESFERMCIRYGKGADFVVIPDVVGDSEMTIYLAQYWVPRLKDLGFEKRLFFVWQDGMKAEDLHPFICDGINIFVGGTTSAKLENMDWISSMCEDWNVYCHIGRVNTKNRLHKCIRARASSFDGSAWSCFPHTFQYLEQLEKQPLLFPSRGHYPLLRSREERCLSLDINKESLVDWEMEMRKQETAGIGAPSKGHYSVLYT